MSEQLKYVVRELNKPPFNKNYNLISFDSLDTLQILQVLTDVLSEVDPKQKMDVREEAADQTAIRIFGCLRVLKFKPPADGTSMSEFRQGLVQGDKRVVVPILQWLLQQMQPLKKRAYLASYLVKVEVPSDFIADEHVADLFAKYEQLIDDFKLVHREVETLRNSGFSTGDIKKDITSMEEEKETLIRRVDRLKRKVSKRVDRLKRKVESQPNTGPMLQTASNLRVEKDREENVMRQKAEQKNMLVQSEQRIHRLQQQIKDTKQASIGTTPEGLLQKLEEEVKINKYMVVEKLPREVSSRRSAVQDLQRVVAEPAMGQADLAQIQGKIKSTNAEVNQLIEKRMMTGDPTDDKLSLFRQQAAIITRKKEAAAETLRKTREESTQLETEVEEKRGQSRQGNGEEVLKGEEFKKYVNKLRTKSTVYKKKRQEMAELRAEAGVLARTQEILKQRENAVNQHLGNIESKRGVSGYRETQEALENVSELKGQLDMAKGRTLEDISYLVQQLTRRITEKKNSLAPIIKDLRPKRQEAQELTQEFEQKKSQYDTMLAGLESNRSKLEQEVRAMREETMAEESRYHYLKTMNKMIAIQQDRINQEMKAYVSPDANEKKKTLREQYSKKVQEQENLGRTLREKQKYVRESHEPNQRQMTMWRDFNRLMECKVASRGGGRQMSGGMRGSGGGRVQSAGYGARDDDRLVL